MAINSNSYWNDRFKIDWESNKGPEQSRFFSKIAIEHLPKWFIDQLRVNKLTLADWGCAQGDGTDVWASYIDPSQITGIDFSSVAIEKALQHYPAIRFISENWLDLLTEQKESFDVVFSSNTLEHFHQPYNVLNTISSHATKSIVLILPYKEHDRITEHFSSFLPENIPLVLKNRFRLAWSKIIDCRMIPNTFWLGEQIVLIYATINWLDTIGIVLKDCLIEQIDSEARLNYLKSEHSKQISLINQSLAEHDALISSLNQSLVERDALISSLNQSLVERGNQITDLTQILLNKNQEISSTKTELEAAISQYTKIMESNSMRFTSFARHLRRTLSLGLHLLVIFIQTAKALGLRNAISKTQTFLMQKIARPKSISELTLSNQDRYLMEQSAQKNYLKNYLAGEIEVNHLNFIHENFPQNIFKSKKILIYPLSYPMELTQRPDHILRYFAENGYSCFILTIDNSPFFIKEILPNIYLTNLFASVISYFSNKSLVFYITYPFFSYVEKHLRKSITIYDILDDLSVFSLNCEAMRLDHKYLLDKADISLFSSQELLDTNKQFAKGQTFLVNNGVWINDFKIDQEQTNSRINFKKHPDEFVIGYHGAISELLDWELIEQLIKIPKLRFVFIGPITQFDHKIGEISQTLQQKVLISDQVTHIPPVAYSVLKNYLVGFDAGIIPFVINEKTNPVAPLKLFEYMAMGLIIFATPTKTLSRFSNIIYVADKNNLPAKVLELMNRTNISSFSLDYSNVLNNADWAKQLKPVISLLEQKDVNQTKNNAKAKTVDILNINFYDWNGITLFKGGAERYIYDLASLMKKNGWYPRIIQNANKPFNIDFRGIPVIGIQTKSDHDLRKMSKAYREICFDADLVIASPVDLACELWGLNVIGINHGIYWDHKFKKLKNFSLDEYRTIFDSIKNSSKVVAVDTNFINWTRTYDYNLAKKLIYIPNYFDGKSFFPISKNFNEKIRILYPRRLYEARGIFITLKALDYLFGRHKEIELHLVGQTDSENKEIILEFIEKFSDRVIWEEFDMEEMYKVYQTSHIVLIPTMYAEGTSLSCIEAMSTNNAVITTNVGGLPNLIIDRFNGMLINPTTEALIQSIEVLLSDRNLMKNIASRGVELSACFEKAEWALRWCNIINEKNS